MRLGEESLPGAYMTSYKKADPSHIGDTLSGLPKEHEGQAKPPKIHKMVGRKNWSKQVEISYNVCRKKGIHRFFCRLKGLKFLKNL
jgi:hypothetical protein